MEYQVTEIFYSVQSEGPEVGRPAVFIRFAGCNLQCSFCDTDYSTKMTLNTHAFLKEIKKVMVENKLLDGSRAQAHGIMFVLTGGEPMCQISNGDFINMLYAAFPTCTVAIETNGTVNFIPNVFLRGKPVVVVSPKEKHRVYMDRKYISAVKFVVDTFKTGELRRIQNKAHNFSGIPIYIQHVDEDSPTYSKRQANHNIIYQFLNRNPTWKLSLQYHKMLGVQ